MLSGTAALKYMEQACPAFLYNIYRLYFAGEYTKFQFSLDSLACLLKIVGKITIINLKICLPGSRNRRCGMSPQSERTSEALRLVHGALFTAQL